MGVLVLVHNRIGSLGMAVTWVNYYDRYTVAWLEATVNKLGAAQNVQQMYLQGTGQTAPSLKEASAENQNKPADDSFRDGAVCPVPC